MNNAQQASDTLNTKLERDAAIEFAQLQQLVFYGNRASLLSAVLGLVLAYTQIGRIGEPFLTAWLAVLFVTVAVRISVNLRYARNPTQEAALVHRRLFTVRAGILSSSLVWGLAVFLFSPTSQSTHEMFFAFMIAGMSAGGVMAYAIDIKSAVMYTSILVLPMATRFLFSDGGYAQAMGVSGYLYLLYVLVTLRNVNKDLLENITLRLDAIESANVLKASEERYKSLLNHLPVGVMHYDHQLNITYSNQKVLEILRGVEHGVDPKHVNAMGDAAIINVMTDALNGETTHYEGHYHSDKHAEKTWVHLISTPSQDSHGNVYGGIAIVQDVSAQKHAQEEITQLAFYDVLTNLPNRRLLLQRLNHAVATSLRTGKRGAIIYIDLDHFKTLNDTLGHDVGDLLLKQVAERLKQSVRAVDTVARIGGDEYVILLENLNEDRAEAVAEVELVGVKIRDALNHSYQFDNYEYFSTPSMGVAMFGDTHVTTDELLKQADIAMYQAKKAGRNALRCFNPRMQEMINARMTLEDELRKALEQKQFQLYYQVQVDQHLMPIGAEALLRWKNSSRGMVSPLEFVPVAEETGLIIPIGLWVLESACAQLKKWQQKPETKQLTLSINVSARQFHQTDFVGQVTRAVQQYGINPALLKLELTETMLLDHTETTIATMNAIRELGVSFSLDDFGTGYSSLQYLKELPLQQLKMDQSFVRDIALDDDDKAIACTIIAVAQRLQMEVIAEGVETQEQMQFLLSHGCHRFQGHYFGKPQTAPQFEKALKKTMANIQHETEVIESLFLSAVSRVD